MRMMGLDVGDRRIGVALCDPLQIVSTALTTIERDQEETEFRQIISLVHQHRVERIIIGLPRLWDGGIGTQAEKTQKFADHLSRLTDVPIEMFDERLSTDLAQDMLRESGKNELEIRKLKDQAAATLILQWYIDEKAAVSGTD